MVTLRPNGGSQPPGRCSGVVKTKGVFDSRKERMMELIESTLKLANELDETQPNVIFYLASYLQLPKVRERCKAMLKEAKRRYQAGELIKDGSRRRTLGGCWLDQLTDEERASAHKIRVAFRAATNTEKHDVPKEFLQEIGF